MLNPNQIGPSSVSMVEKRSERATRGEIVKKRKKENRLLNLPCAFGNRFHVISMSSFFLFFFNNKLVETSFILLISSSVSRLELEAETKGAERKQENGSERKKSKRVRSKRSSFIRQSVFCFLFFFSFA